MRLLASVLAIGGPTGDCDRGADSRTYFRLCPEALSSEADVQLIYTEHARRDELTSVTGRDDALKIFDKAGTEFRVFCESACRLARVEVEPGTGAGDFERDCMVRMTRNWIDGLRSHSISENGNQ